MAVSLNTFISKAQEKPEGEVRFAKDKGDELVNKGTLGNRISTWFKDIKEYFTGADPTRATRQGAAVRAFERAMAGEFDDAITNAALAGAGIRRNRPMTGAQIEDAVGRARAAVAQNNATRAQHMSAYVIGPPASPQFVAIAQRTVPAVMPRTFPPAAQAEFQSRLAQNLETESRRGRVALTAADVDRVALETLNEVHRLSSAPDGVEALRTSIAARRELVESYKDVFRACAAGRDPGTMAGLLATTVGRSTAVVVSDRNPDAPDDASNRAADLAATLAATELQAEPGDLVRRAHAMALTPDSSLRAITAAAQTVAEGGARRLPHEAMRRHDEEGARADDVAMLRAGAVLTQARNAINGMGRAMGLDSATRSDHLQVHHNGMSPPDPAVLAAGRAALDPVLPGVRIS